MRLSSSALWLNLCLIVILWIGTGCVGPMSPFGGMAPPFDHKLAEEPATPDTSSYATPQARVRFTPEHQNLHGATPLSVVVEDPSGVPEDAILLVSYNGRNVTRSFLAQAEVTSLDPLRHEVRWTAHNMRLPAARDHRIRVSYWHDHSQPSVSATYQPPSCSAFTANHLLLNVPGFQPPVQYIQLINQSAMNRKINPFFIAALVAQESGFDARAVSRSRAIGLTQVTALGDAEVSRRFAYWPRYPGAGEMPFVVLKMAVLGGQIHSGNEWRLDPALSIQGGVEYLNYLSEYWAKPEKRALLERRLGPSETALSEVMLASYNSGATRVSEALEEEGDRYLKAPELAEANRYVRRVVSYCDQFEHGGD